MQVIKKSIFFLLTALVLSSVSLPAFAQDAYDAGYQLGTFIGSLLVFIIFILIFILTLVNFGIFIWVLVDLVNTKKAVNKTLWAIIILLVPFGNLVYLFGVKFNKNL